MKKALIAMSGGVDSSVAAYITKENGFECIGATMRLFDNEDAGLCSDRTCCSIDDSEDARLVCNKIGIKHYVLDFRGNFRENVINKFIKSYETGETPNPCVDCNRYLKFQGLYQKGELLGYEYLVTGHYARICRDEKTGRWLLKKALDKSKDQSYVLYSLSQKQLAHTLFPLGNMEKSRVRSIAVENGFINAKKRESQDICFVPDGDYAAAIKRLAGKDYEEGDFVDAAGNVLGKHRGIIKYTIGQRKGLGLALPEPMYVIEKDVKNNRIVLGRNSDLFAKKLEAVDLNWIVYDTPPRELRVKARIRYSQKEQPATVINEAGGRTQLLFDEPQRAITPGQAVVLYDGDTVIGGGTIA